MYCTINDWRHSGSRRLVPTHEPRPGKEASEDFLPRFGFRVWGVWTMTHHVRQTPMRMHIIWLRFPSRPASRHARCFLSFGLRIPSASCCAFLFRRYAIAPRLSVLFPSPAFLVVLLSLFLILIFRTRQKLFSILYISFPFIISFPLSCRSYTLFHYPYLHTPERRGTMQRCMVALQGRVRT